MHLLQVQHSQAGGMIMSLHAILWYINAETRHALTHYWRLVQQPENMFHKTQRKNLGTRSISCLNLSYSLFQQWAGTNIINIIQEKTTAIEACLWCEYKLLWGRVDITVLARDD